MNGRRPVFAAIACAVIGATLVVFVESPYALGAGVVLLFAFIAIGATAIATPDYLGRDDED